MPPDPFQHLKSFIIPVDGSEAAFHALNVACELARRTKGAQVHVVHVIEVPRSLPLDADLPDQSQRGETILDRAEQIGAGYKVTVHADLLQARQAAHAVVDEAIERAVDAIVVGVDYHRPHGRFALGRLPTYVLEHSPTEVWLFRYPPPEGAIYTRPGTVWSR
ncbi:MAG: universal stress protein [Chloroflexi bacterium]|nr:universal stress protein [Chloroflexota bacterium]MQC27787.1 universal stress protein [Chloroflexota bacterium]